MSKFNSIFYIQAYQDRTSTNSPQLSNFKWTREQQGLTGSKPLSTEFMLAPGESRVMFDGSRSLSQTGSTQYSLAPKSSGSQTYVLQWVGGPNPVFRTARSTGADATTQAGVTLNGTVMTIASTGGTAFNFISGGVQVGDNVNLAGPFNVLNQGLFKVIAVTATSISVVNPNAVAESVTLGSGFALAVEIFSAAGVQVGDTLRIFGGFSLASQGAYEITGVYSDRIEFFSESALPTETVTTNSIAVYYESRKLAYMEADQKVQLTINGSVAGEIEPFIEPTFKSPGMFLRTSTMWSFSVQNTSLDSVTIFMAAIE